MVDRVRPLKLESPTRGTESDEYHTELDPKEDHLEARGLFLQTDSSDDENAHITRDSSNRITVKDTEISSPTTLRELRTAQYLYTGAEEQGKTLQTDGSSGIQLAAVVSGYPPSFDTGTDDTTSTTTLTTWQQKYRLTTPSLELGSYIFFVQAVLSGSKSNTEYEARIQYDDSDTFGTLNAQAGIPFSELPFFTHTIKNTISGVHTIDVDYRKVSGSGYVLIRGIRVTYWRASAS